MGSLLNLQSKIEDSPDEGETRIKLVAVGDGAVGKTSLLISFAKGTFPDAYVPTVFENYTAQMDHSRAEEGKVLLHLWDTAGQEDYDRLRPLSYPGADVILLCFSLVTESSFESIVGKWNPEITHYIKDVPKVLVGTKVDLREAELPDPSTGDYEPVSTEQGESLAEEIGAEKFIEVSAKTGKKLHKLFQETVDIVLDHRKKNYTPIEDGKDEGAENNGNYEIIHKPKTTKCSIL
eukprot:TRINITY_DN1184_c0_g1_i2.p1 TRINITY_DN1184_c0_g1~~TRINITY_DN1184_c0_g1_i2.p1  ORF type:complete len:235 (+),score=65.89 TRINITY_DN1184_c0_g1_i2:176-880(+)